MDDAETGTARHAGMVPGGDWGGPGRAARRNNPVKQDVGTMNKNGKVQQANMAVVRRLVEEALGQGQVRLLPDLVTPEHVSHLTIGDHFGPEGVRIDIAGYRMALHDLRVTVDDLFADGDRVARRFTLVGTLRRAVDGVPGDEEQVVLRGIAIDRLTGERVAESWVHMDPLPWRDPGAGS